MGHVILLGDSIFDNAQYVPGRPAVIAQLRQAVPNDWRATLLAVDGHMTGDVEAQVKKLPADATHLIVSAGGNDALAQSAILNAGARTVGEALGHIARLRGQFRETYRTMLRVLEAIGKPTVVCTIYDSVPGLEPAQQAALAGFNEVILREACRARLPIIDLRLLCDQPADYSQVSPIEPSEAGGAKIARVIAEVATAHDFCRRQCTLYC